MIEQEIGKRISSLRKESNETQECVANAINVKREIINHWETGRRKIKAEHIIALANHFDVCSDYLLGLSVVPNATAKTRSQDPCEYCRITVPPIMFSMPGITDKDGKRILGIDGFVVGDSKTLALSVAWYDHEVLNAEIGINYCPMCGRRLK